MRRGGVVAFLLALVIVSAIVWVMNKTGMWCAIHAHYGCHK